VSATGDAGEPRGPVLLEGAPSADRPSRTDPARQPRRAGWLSPLLLRLHFYAGVFVGPFVLVAAASGALYALTPQIEQAVYDHELHAPAGVSQLALREQILAADAYVGPDEQLVAVRPAPEPGDTTRVMYAGDALGASETRAIFVDPATAEIRGDLTAYGTSGALPVRTWVTQLHRSLHLGEPGRLYSELAASWLGVVAVAGLGLWGTQRWRARRKKTQLKKSQRKTARRPAATGPGYARTRSRHTTTGLWVLGVALFLSATGITWSEHGGGNVSDLRAAVGWTTPAVSTDLSGAGGDAPDEHAGHHGGAPAGTVATTDVSRGAFDSVLAIAQDVNVDTGLVEIRPPTEAGSAWVVQEIQRSYPTEVDAVAIDGQTMKVVDRVDFDDFSLVAKLSRWGIDLHMGSMFGLANQLVLFVAGSAIAAMVVWGYVMWWQRRPRRGTRRVGKPPERGVLRRTPWWATLLALLGAAALGTFLPLLGLTLAAFLVGDALVGLRGASRRDVPVR